MNALELYKKTCMNKRRFNPIKHDVDTVHHYKCPYCRNYHVTSGVGKKFEDENLVMRDTREYHVRQTFIKYRKFISNLDRLVMGTNGEYYEIRII